LDDDVFTLLPDGTFKRCPSKSYPGEDRKNWVLTTNPHYAYELICDRPGEIDVVSFDNDIGTEFKDVQGNPLEGRHVLNWLEERAYFGLINLSKADLRVHSANTEARRYMLQTIENIKKHSAVNYNSVGEEE
jgi:hypothetical protein